MTGWRELEQELDAWATAGQRATLWWRDDDAAEPTAALDRLLDLSAAQNLPLALAVVPGRCSHGLSHRLAGDLQAMTPLQHGYRHLNHAGADQKKAELGDHRPLPVVCEELARGAALMAANFGERALPVLVPPWNRIAPRVIAALPEIGLSGLSTHKPRTAENPVPGITQVNTHVDIMRWTAPRGFLGEAEALGLLCGHLRARRGVQTKEQQVDRAEPTGLLTHHLAHDAAAWGFLEQLLPLLARHPAALMLGARDVFAAAGQAT